MSSTILLLEGNRLLQFIIFHPSHLLEDIPKRNATGNYGSYPLDIKPKLFKFKKVNTAQYSSGWLGDFEDKTVDL
jgi:hypothetical protein